MPNDYPVNFLVQLPASLRHRLKVLAATRDTSMKELTIQALTSLLAEAEEAHEEVRDDDPSISE